MHVGGDGALEQGDAAELELLADDPGHLLDRLGHGLAVGHLGTGERVAVLGTDLVGQRDDLVGEGLEVGVLGHEVGLAEQLDQRAALRGDQAVLGGALGATLGGLGRTGDAQDLDGGVEVAVGLGEGLLALHHPGGGEVAELLDVRGGDRSHGLSFLRWGAVAPD